VEMTIEQKRAIALASARLRLQEQGARPPAAPPAQPRNWRDDLADVVELARPGAIGQRINKGIEHAGYNTGAFVNDQAAKVVRPEVAAGLGVAANVGVQALPMLLGGEFGKAVQPAFEAGGEKMMQKALRPTWEMLRSGKAQRAATTMLEEGYNPTRGGVNAMRMAASKSDDLAEALLSPSASTVDTRAVANRLGALLTKVEKSPLPEAGINAVQSAKAEFLAHPLSSPTSVLTGRSDIPVQLAQEMKQAAYRQLGDAAYGSGLKPAAERDALKALARGLKEEIEAAVPGVAPLNARTGELLNAAKVAERRALVGGNNNIIPLGASVATAVNNPAAAVGLWANSSDIVKSLLARMLYSGQIPANLGRVAGAAYGARLGKAQEESP